MLAVRTLHNVHTHTYMYNSQPCPLQSCHLPLLGHASAPAQEPGEFIVLNAAAYHAGYNLGFNCAGACVAGAAECAAVVPGGREAWHVTRDSQ